MFFFDALFCFQSGCEDMQFAVELINQLVQAFLAAHDTRAQVINTACFKITFTCRVCHLTR